MSQINQAQHGIASSPGGSAPSGGYPTFDAVVYYDDPADTTINANAGELIYINLAGIGDDVTVVFPAVVGPAGQSIGIVCETADGTHSIQVSGPVSTISALDRSGEAVTFASITTPDYPSSPQWIWWQQWHEAQAVSLQAAYDGGNSIALAADTPVDLNAPTDTAALLIVHDGSAPPAELGVIDLTMADDTGSWAALLIENAGTAAAQTRIVRLLNAARAEVWFELRPDALYFNVPRATQTYALLVASEGKALSLQTDRALAGDGSTCGQLKVGPAFGPNDCDGGITIEGVDSADVGTCTGRVRVETHALGATVADDRQGALRLPNVGGVTNALECSPAAEGDTVLRTDEVSPPEVFRTKGFRGYREGAYGLFARGYQRTFEDADLTAGVLTVDHNLDTRGPVVAIYDDGGNLVPIVAAPLFPSVVEGTDPDNQLDVAITATSITGTWRITVLGF